jgi:hypothetical protein
MTKSKNNIIKTLLSIDNMVDVLGVRFDEPITNRKKHDAFRLLLIYYVREIDRIANKMTGKHLIFYKDLKHINKVDIRVVIDTLKYIHEYKHKFIWPWCTKDGFCSKCEYGNKHGLCFLEDSTYKQILNRLSVINNSSKYKGLLIDPEIRRIASNVSKMYIMIKDIKIDKNKLSIQHKLLIQYLTRKNKIIKGLTGLDLISPKDINEIEEWSLEKVVKSLDKIGGGTDLDNCPWCTHYNRSDKEDRSCNGCGYGLRNGRCINEMGFPTGLYYIILTELRKTYGYKRVSEPARHLCEEIKNVYRIIKSIV